MTEILPFTSPVKSNSIYLRCTGVLNKKIDTILFPYATCDNPLVDWHVHLFTQKRTQYMLYMNSSTLFSFISYGKGVFDEASLIDTTPDRLRDGLAVAGFAHVYDDVIAKVSRSFMLTKTKSDNRSIIGSMNQLVRCAKILIEYDDGDLPLVAKKLNETHMNAINTSPMKAFTEMTNRYFEGLQFTAH